MWLYIINDANSSSQAMSHNTIIIIIIYHHLFAHSIVHRTIGERAEGLLNPMEQSSTITRDICTVARSR